ncbi:MAG: hypothetical protein E7639_02165 [Ruminococcaceae bacterium]|nr:hypothetical protein [Oscillospiraceae bacterium]
MAKKKNIKQKPKEKKSIVAHILRLSCIYYTITTFLLIFLFWLISNDITRAMHPVALMLILPFCICFAAANTLWSSAVLSGFPALLVHYALTIGSIWLFLFLPNKNPDAQASGALILFLALTLIYAVVMGFVVFMRRRIKHLTRESSEYTSVYKN